MIGNRVPYKDMGYDTFEQYLWTIPHVCRIKDYEDRTVVIPVVDEKSKHINNLVLLQKDVLNSCNKRSTIFHENTEEKNNNETDLSTIFANFLNLTTTEVITLLNKERPLGMTLENPVYNENPPLEIVHSQIDLNLTDVQRPPLKYISDLDDVNLYDNALVRQPYFRLVKDHCNIPEKVKKNLRKLIEKHPQGIWCSQLLNLYSEQYNESLNLGVYLLSSVYEMCLYLPYLFYLYRPLDHGDFKIVDVRNPKPKNTLFCFHIEEECYIPEYVVEFGSTLKCQWLENDVQHGDYLPVKVCAIDEPTRLWIQLLGPETSDELENLYIRMQNFYMLYHGTLRLCYRNCKLGLICATLIKNKFYRTIIVGYGNMCDDFKVYLIDYGGYARVDLKNLCFLHKEFAILPMQAIKARLANIIPKSPNNKWSLGVVDFIDSITKNVLIAYIDSIDLEKQILNIVLTDTTNPEMDIHINDLLVEREYAEFGTFSPDSSLYEFVIDNMNKV